MQKITSSKLKHLIDDIPGSKSYANRALIYNYIKGGSISIKNLPLSDDVQNTLRAIEQVQKGNSELFLGEGGTTIRFLLPVLALRNQEFLVRVKPSFKKRPMEEMFKYLRALACELSLGEKEDELCRLKGPLKKDRSLEVDCSKSSQFLSAFELIKEEIGLKLSYKNLDNSRPYYEMTKKIISELKVKNTFIVPVDMSSAAYPIVWAILNQDIIFSQIKERDPYQADSLLFEVLESGGGIFSFTADGLEVKKSYLNAFQVDVKNAPDLTMALTYLALFTEGTSEIRGVKNLVYKEVDRIEGLLSLLKQINAKFELDDNCLRIYGRSYTPASILKPLEDHRLVILASLILKQFCAQGEITEGKVENPQAVTKSFPNFFDIF